MVSFFVRKYQITNWQLSTGINIMNKNKESQENEEKKSINIKFMEILSFTMANLIFLEKRNKANSNKYTCCNY